MRSRPSATWTWLPLSAALLAGCGAREHEPPDRRAVQHRPFVSYVSEDGVRFVPGEPKVTKPAHGEDWRTVAFEDGELRLRLGHCAHVLQVNVGPADGELRRVHVLTGDSGSRCTRVVRLRPEGWTAETVAVAGAVTLPDPRRTRHLRPSTGSGGVLQPDRRTVVIPYTAGVCSELVKADATLRDGTVHVRVTLGDDPDRDDGTVCPLVGIPSYALARLPEPAPPGAHVRVDR